MKYAHNIKATVFSYENENKGEILNAFLELFPFNLENSKVQVKHTNAAGFSEKKIEILEVYLEKPSLVSKFLANLISKIKDIDKSLIISQIESRLDNELDFFLRLDKESWIKERKLEITDSGKCFHIKMSVAAFPKKREIAVSLLKDLFSGKEI